MAWKKVGIDTAGFSLRLFQICGYAPSARAALTWHLLLTFLAGLLYNRLIELFS
jgi:hypothetical protein